MAKRSDAAAIRRFHELLDKRFAGLISASESNELDGLTQDFDRTGAAEINARLDALQKDREALRNSLHRIEVEIKKNFPKDAPSRAVKPAAGQKTDRKRELTASGNAARP